MLLAIQSRAVNKPTGICLWSSQSGFHDMARPAYVVMVVVYFVVPKYTRPPAIITLAQQCHRDHYSTCLYVPGYSYQNMSERYQWPLLLTWFNFNPSMNDTPSKVWDEITYPCKELKLIHISKRDLRCSQHIGFVVCRECYLCVSTPSVSKEFALSVSSLRDMCLRHL